MGIRTDFVIAARDAGDAIGRTPRHDETWPTYSARNVDTVMLARLYCCATGTPYSEELQSSFPIVGGDDETVWVLEFPPDLLAGIAGIADADAETVAAEWARTEELRRWTLEAATEFVERIAAHARRTVDESAMLYVRIAL